MRDTIDKLLEFLISITFIAMITIVVSMMINIKRIDREFNSIMQNNDKTYHFYSNNKNKNIKNKEEVQNERIINKN